MGFLNPAGLLASLLLGVLVALYLLARRRRRVEVPSLLLWTDLRDDLVQRSRFRPDALFLLQALLLTALILGLARPFLHGEALPRGAARHVVIVDTSASMQAREGEETRFALAQRAAERFLYDTEDGDEIMLITAAARPEIVVDFTRDRAAAIRAVRGLLPSDTRTSLSAAVALAQRARSRDPQQTGIALFTDLPPTALEPEARPLVHRFGFGTSDDNLAISSLRVFQGPFDDPERARAYVLVTNFSHAERHGSLTVRVGDRPVLQTGFTLPGRRSRTFMASGFPRSGLLVAAIEVGDALPVDDRAFGWIRGRRDVEVLLVSDPTPLVRELQEIGSAVPGLRFQHVTPEELAAGVESEADTVIFHRVAPEEHRRNALYIHPGAGNPVFRVLGTARDIEVVDWNEEHESLGGLQLLLASPVGEASIVQPPPGSRTLLWSRSDQGEFPLAFTLDAEGRRSACIAFDLEAEHLRSNENVPLLLLFLNLLDWLVPGNGSTPALVDTGAFQSLDTLPAGVPARIVDPRGEVHTLPASSRELEADLAGLYQVTAGGGAQAIIANLFDTAESDIGRGDQQETPWSAASGAPAERYARAEIGSWLYGAALFLLVLEWLAWRRRA